MLRRWLSFKVATRLDNIVGATSAARLIAGQFKEKKMKYPVNSICIIVDTHETYAYLRGRDCTITEHLDPDKYAGNDYRISIQGEEDNNWASPHHFLRLKKFPGQLQSWLTKKMDKLLTPNPYIVAEEV